MENMMLLAMAEQAAILAANRGTMAPAWHALISFHHHLRLVDSEEPFIREAHLCHAEAILTAFGL